MNYDSDTKTYQYVRIDGSIHEMKDPFPSITETYWQKDDDQFNPEDKVSWDELAPSLQELIIDDTPVEFDELSVDVQNKFNRLSEFLDKDYLEQVKVFEDAIDLLESQIRTAVNLKDRVDVAENEIENIWFDLNKLQEINAAILERLAALELRIGDLEDASDTLGGKIRALQNEIYFLWGGVERYPADATPEQMAAIDERNRAKYEYYKNTKYDNRWVLPKIWYDFWFLWSRDTNHTLTDASGIPLLSDASKAEETTYETDYVSHKLTKFNIPHIWDELWYLWGGKLAASATNESDNEATFNKYRWRYDTGVVANDRPEWNIPHIWYDFWFLWSRYTTETKADPTTTITYDLSTDEVTYEDNYLGHKLEKHNIPHIWDEFWKLWGANKPVSITDTLADEVNNEAIFDKYSNHSPLWDMPHVWYDIWSMWSRTTRDADSVVTDTYAFDVTSDTVTNTIEQNFEADYILHKKPRFNFPHVWDELWYLWGGKLAASNDNEAANEATFNKYRWRYDTGTAANDRPEWNIPHVWYDIWSVWSRTTEQTDTKVSATYDVTDDTQEITFEDNYLDHKRPRFNIPHIWDELWWLWGGEKPIDPTNVAADEAHNEAIFDKYRNHTSWNIPNIWYDIWSVWSRITRDTDTNIPATYSFDITADSDTNVVEQDFEEDYAIHKRPRFNIPHIWDEIWYLWGGDKPAITANEAANEATFNSYRWRNKSTYLDGTTKHEWNIPHIWYDIWDMWSRTTRETDSKVTTKYDFIVDSDTSGLEATYEDNYLRHKHPRFNIPHIWDEFWWLWGAKDTPDSNEAEDNNEALFDKYRNHLPSWDLPHIWYDIWSVWSRVTRDTDTVISSVYEFDTTSSDNTIENAFESNYINHKKPRFNIPHIWDELWYLWGGDELYTADADVTATALIEASNETKFKNYRWRYRDQTYSDGTTKKHEWNIPHIWYDIWSMWSRTTEETDTVVTDTYNVSVTTEEDNFEDNYLEHKKPRFNIPHIWDELWYLWGGSKSYILDANDPDTTISSIEKDNEAIFNKYRWRYNTATPRPDWNIPHIWYDIWDMWSRTTRETDSKVTTKYDFIVDSDTSGLEATYEDNYLRHKHPRFNIPHIWDELWHLWGGTETYATDATIAETALVEDANEATFNKYRWRYLDVNEYGISKNRDSWTLPNIWYELWYLWGGDKLYTIDPTDTDTTITSIEDENETTFHKYRRRYMPDSNLPQWNIPHIWYDIWSVWSRITQVQNPNDPVGQRSTYDVSVSGDEKKFEQNYQYHNQPKWNIPHIWDEIWHLWGGTNTSYTHTSLEADEIIEGQNEATFIANRKPQFNIPSIWGSDLMPSKTSTTNYNLSNIWGNNLTAKDNPTPYNLSNIWGENAAVTNSDTTDKYNLSSIWSTGNATNTAISSANTLSHNIPSIWGTGLMTKSDTVPYNVSNIWGSFLLDTINDPLVTILDTDTSSYNISSIWSNLTTDTIITPANTLSHNIPNIWGSKLTSATDTFLFNISSIWGSLIDDIHDPNNPITDTTPYNISNIWKNLDDAWGPNTDVTVVKSIHTISNIWESLWFLWSPTDTDIVQAFDSDANTAKLNPVKFITEASFKHNIPYIWKNLDKVWNAIGEIWHQTGINSDSDEYYNTDTTNTDTTNLPVIRKDLDDRILDLNILWSVDTDVGVATDTAIGYNTVRDKKYSIPHIWGNEIVELDIDTNINTLPTFVEKYNISNIWGTDIVGLAKDTDTIIETLEEYIKKYNISNIWGTDIVGLAKDTDTVISNYNISNLWGTNPKVRKYLSAHNISSIWGDTITALETTNTAKFNISSIWGSNDNILRDPTNYNISKIWDFLTYVDQGLGDIWGSNVYVNKNRPTHTLSQVWENLWLLWSTDDDLITPGDFADQKSKAHNIPNIWNNLDKVWAALGHIWGTYDINSSNFAVGPQYFGEKDIDAHNLPKLKTALDEAQTNIKNIWGSLWKDTSNGGSSVDHETYNINKIWTELYRIWFQPDDGMIESAYGFDNFRSHLYNLPHIWGNNVAASETSSLNISSIWGTNNTVKGAPSTHNISSIWGTNPNIVQGPATHNISKIWEAIGHLWGNNNSVETADHSGLNIDQIWNAIKNLWGTTATQEEHGIRNIKKIWDELDKKALEEDLVATWGNDEKRSNSKTWNIEAIWEELNKKALETDIVRLWGSNDKRNDYSTWNINELWNTMDTKAPQTDIDNLWGDATKQEDYDTWNINKIWDSLDTKALEEDMANIWGSIDKRTNYTRWNIQAIWNRLGELTPTEETEDLSGSLQAAIKRLWGLDPVDVNWQDPEHETRNISRIWDELNTKTTATDFRKAIRNLWGSTLINSDDVNAYEPSTSTDVNLTQLWNAIRRLWGKDTALTNYNTTYEDSKWQTKSIEDIWGAIKNLWGSKYINTDDDYTPSSSSITARNIGAIWENIKLIWGSYYENSSMSADNSLASLDTKKADKSEINDIWGIDNKNANHNITETWRKINNIDSDITVLKSDIDTIWGGIVTNDRASKDINDIWNNIDQLNSDISIIWGDIVGSNRPGQGISDIWAHIRDGIWGDVYHKDSSDSYNIKEIWEAIKNIWGDTYKQEYHEDYNIDEIWSRKADLANLYQHINRIWVGSNDTSAPSSSIDYTTDNIKKIWEKMKTKEACSSDMANLTYAINELKAWTKYDTDSAALGNLYDAIHEKFYMGVTNIVTTDGKYMADIPQDYYDTEVANFGHWYNTIGNDAKELPGLMLDQNGNPTTDTRTISARLARLEEVTGLPIGPQGDKIGSGQVGETINFATLKENIRTLNDEISLIKRTIGLDLITGDGNTTENIMVRLARLESENNALRQILTLMGYAPQAVSLVQAQTTAINDHSNQNNVDLTGLIGAVNNLRSTLKSGQDNIETAIKTNLSNAVTSAGGSIRTGEDNIEKAIKDQTTTLDSDIGITLKNVIEQVDRDLVDYGKALVSLGKDLNDTLMRQSLAVAFERTWSRQELLNTAFFGGDWEMHWMDMEYQAAGSYAPKHTSVNKGLAALVGFNITRTNGTSTDCMSDSDTHLHLQLTAMMDTINANKNEIIEAINSIKGEPSSTLDDVKTAINSIQISSGGSESGGEDPSDPTP